MKCRTMDDDHSSSGSKSSHDDYKSAAAAAVAATSQRKLAASLEDHQERALQPGKLQPELRLEGASNIPGILTASMVRPEQLPPGSVPPNLSSLTLEQKLRGHLPQVPPAQRAALHDGSHKTPEELLATLRNLEDVASHRSRGAVVPGTLEHLLASEATREGGPSSTAAALLNAAGATTTNIEAELAAARRAALLSSVLNPQAAALNPQASADLAACLLRSQHAGGLPPQVSPLQELLRQRALLAAAGGAPAAPAPAGLFTEDLLAGIAAASRSPNVSAVPSSLLAATQRQQQQQQQEQASLGGSTTAILQALQQQQQQRLLASSLGGQQPPVLDAQQQQQQQPPPSVAAALAVLQQQRGGGHPFSGHGPAGGGPDLAALLASTGAGVPGGGPREESLMASLQHRQRQQQLAAAAAGLTGHSPAGAPHPAVAGVFPPAGGGPAAAAFAAAMAAQHREGGGVPAAAVGGIVQRPAPAVYSSGSFDPTASSQHQNAAAAPKKRQRGGGSHQSRADEADDSYGADIPEPRGYRRKKKKADHPTRPLSAYNLFFRDERAKLLLERQRDPASGKLDFATMAKIIGARWKKISKENLQRYESMADEDRHRYRYEMEQVEERERRSRERNLQQLEDSIDEQTRSIYLRAHELE